MADPKDQSIVILDKEEQIVINRKQQPCFVFEVGGERCYAIQRYVHVVEEGAAANLFDPSLPGPDDPMFQKPKKPKKWRKSKAKKLLYNHFMEGVSSDDEDSSEYPFSSKRAPEEDCSHRASEYHDRVFTKAANVFVANKDKAS